jgi:hypothetical protein
MRSSPVTAYSSDRNTIGINYDRSFAVALPSASGNCFGCCFTASAAGIRCICSVSAEAKDTPAAVAASDIANMFPRFIALLLKI